MRGQRVCRDSRACAAVGGGLPGARRLPGALLPAILVLFWVEVGL